MQILNLLIWQSNGSVRNFEFKENCVNVISGESGKGKSTILEIINYCLLSSDSTYIPKTNIDNKIEWYGIRVKIKNNIYTICRNAIRYKNENKAYFSYQGEIPDIPQNTSSIDDVKFIINRDLGIDNNLVFPFGSRNISQGSKISYRHFLNYNFIDQETITSREKLHSKSSKERVVETIQRILFMALGFENSKNLIRNQELDRIKKKIDLLNKKKASIEENHGFDIEYWFNKLIQLGLISSFEKYQDNNQKLELLRNLSKISDIKEIEIFNEIANIENEIFKLTQEEKDFNNYIKNIKHTKNLEKEIIESTHIARYLMEKYDQILYTQNTTKIINAIVKQGHYISTQLNHKEDKDSLLYKTKEYRKSIFNKKKNLVEILNKKKEITSEISTGYIFKVLGWLERELKELDEKSGNNIEKIQADLNKYNEELKKVESELDLSENKKRDAESFLNNKIGCYLVKMPLIGYETKNPLPILQKNRNEVDISTNSGVEKMSSIGSSSNYMYLHLAYFLAIHSIARQNKVTYMPSFLIIDQPSTPYFSTKSKDNETNLNLQTKQERIDSALTVLNQFIEEMKQYGGFQIILLEHIEPTYWKERNLTNFELVDQRFSDDYGLIHPFLDEDVS